MLKEYDKYAEVVPKNIYQVETYMKSYSGDTKSDMSEQLKKWVQLWIQAAYARLEINRLLLRHKKRTIRELMAFSKTYRKGNQKKVKNNNNDL